jgi:hypothetical protein
MSSGTGSQGAFWRQMGRPVIPYHTQGNQGLQDGGAHYSVESNRLDGWGSLAVVQGEDSGDCLADAGDSWKRRRLRVRQQQSVSICPNRRKTGGVVRQCRTAAMRDMPPKICVNLRNLRIKPFTLSRETDGQQPLTFQCRSTQMPTDYRPIRLRDFVPLS